MSTTDDIGQSHRYLTAPNASSLYLCLSVQISAAEFSHLCFNLGYALTDVELELALKVLDDDNSGEIELNEFKNCQTTNESLG